MKPWHQDDQATIYHGDCREVLRSLPDCSVDSVVTDPPYELGFMGKRWDNTGIAYDADLWAEALRVLKPGGHLLAFGGTRTWHRLAVAVEDAGFEVRDSIAWLYGSGFPKSLDVSKAIDKVNGEGDRLHKFTAWMRTTGLTARQINDATGTFMGSHYLTAKSQPAIPTPDLWALLRPLCGDVPEWVDELVDRIEAERIITQQAKREAVSGEVITFDQRSSTERERRDIPATEIAARWSGWGTALKPAFEPVVVARKPLTGTVAANVLEHGVGGLNIDGCRIDMGAEYDPTKVQRQHYSSGAIEGAFGAASLIGKEIPTYNPAGRWPANVILDEDQADALDRQSGNRPGASSNSNGATASFTTARSLGTQPGYADQGGASRFFYVAKAPARERPKVDGIAHPTVKPLTLMRWLCRLVTPPGGTVLEPFAGSGTTIEAALMEGFHVIAIEREDDYLPLIAARLERVHQEPDDGQLTFDASA